MIELHAAADAAAIVRVEAALDAEGVAFAWVEHEPGRVTPGTVRIELLDELDPEDEAEVREKILLALPEPPATPAGDPVVAALEERVAALLGRVAALEERVQQ